jgi:YVTN family beta-propeller protein
MNAARPGTWSWRLIGALVMGSSFVALSLWIAMIGALPGEQSLRIAIIAALTPPDPVILRTANSLGDRIALVGVGLVTVAICRGWFRDGLRVAAILVLAAAAGGVMTWMIGRPRPEGMGLSYPSGHVFGAHGLYPSRDGTSLYVANRGSSRIGGPPRGKGSISVIDFATFRVEKTWPIPAGGSPDMGNVSADGTMLWLSDRYDNVVYAIDTSTGRVRRIPVGKEPHGLTVWPQPGRYSLGHTGNMR